MTAGKAFKQRVRAVQARDGVSYSEALRRVRAEVPVKIMMADGPVTISRASVNADGTIDVCEWDDR